MEMTMLPLLVLLLLRGAESTMFTFYNNCSFTVWPATQANTGISQLVLTGFTLATGAATTLPAPAGWGGRMWARKVCTTDSSTGRFSCASADCATGQVACNGARGDTPASLVEIILDGNSSQDSYDVSVADGFNLPISITNEGGHGTCGSATCPAHINAQCPAKQKVIVGGQMVGCRNGPNYATFFKSLCPHAYSYQHTDPTSVFTCTAADYLITFCP